MARLPSGQHRGGALVIPSTINGLPVTTIGDGVYPSDAGYPATPFNGLTSVTIPDSVTSIADYAFANCLSLTSATIGNSVTNIGEQAFWGAALVSVTIPDSVTSTGDGAFALTPLNSVVIGSSVTNMGEGTFGLCLSLTNIMVAEQNPDYSSLDSVLFDKNQTTLIQCPARIGFVAGAYTVPDRVTSIGEWAFQFCAGIIKTGGCKQCTNVEKTRSLSALMRQESPSRTRYHR